VAVAYVAGAMRSGTTVIGQMLAASPSTVLLGEIRPVLTMPEQHAQCDSGHQRDSCPFWHEVYQRVPHVPTPDEAARGYRMAQLPRVAVCRVLRRPLPADVRAVVDFLRAVAEVADGRIVIDLSKTPTGIVLWRLAGADVHVVHCLRSVRAVAQAQSRPTSESELPEVQPAKSYLVWLAYNLVALALRPTATSYTATRYRSLRKAPRAIASRVWKRAGASVPDATDGAQFSFQESHMMAGNPRRSRGTSVTVTSWSERPEAERVLPDFVIIGAQKAGSTALMQQLRDHPEVYLPPGETRYFRDPWYQFQDPSVLSTEVATNKPGVLRRGIKCPDLLGLEHGPRRVVDALGPVQLIAVLREPVARAVSAYYWYMQWGYLPITAPEIGFRRLLDGDYSDASPRVAEILEFGLYGKHLARWLDLVPRENLLVLLDDALRGQPGQQLRETFQFLGVRADVPLRRRRANINSGVYSLDRLKFLQRRHRHIIREIPGFEGRYLQRPATPRGWVVDRSVAAVDRLLLARTYSNERPQLSADLQERLARYYRADIADLERLIGRDLTHWTTRYPVAR
jgi:Sulfotransferase domain